MKFTYLCEVGHGSYWSVGSADGRNGVILQVVINLSAISDYAGQLLWVGIR
jgi:hypothetical protein